MASKYLTTTFPTDIDRDRFGDWLAGFTDGEGCFYLGHSADGYASPQTRFGIALRADDLPILQTIQAFFGCGYVHPNCTKARDHTRPQFQYYIQSSKDLWTIIVPFFVRHPLRAKKARDFTIWRQGVELAYNVKNRPWDRGHKCGGCNSKWTTAERELFATLGNALQQQRSYQSPIIEVLPVPQRPLPTGLYDDLP